MSRADRQRAATRLDELIVQGDVRAIETALAVPLPELAATIRQIPPTSPGPVREAAARALARFGDEGAVIELAARLAHGHKQVRINAAHELSKSDDPIATDALLDALSDESRIVRVHAWDGFVRHFGLGSWAEPRHGPLGRLFALLCSDVEAARHRGVDQISEIASRLHEGATPASLGLDVRVPEDDAHTDAFIASVRDPAGPIDVGAIRAMDQHHRDWAVIMLVSESVRDATRPRAALQALGQRWALDAIAS